MELIEMIMSYLVWVNPGGSDTEQEVGEQPHLTPEAEPLAWEAAYEFLSVPTYEELEQWTVGKLAHTLLCSPHRRGYYNTIRGETLWACVVLSL